MFVLYFKSIWNTIQVWVTKAISILHSRSVLKNNKEMYVNVNLKRKWVIFKGKTDLLEIEKRIICTTYSK